MHDDNPTLPGQLEALAEDAREARFGLALRYHRATFRYQSSSPGTRATRPILLLSLALCFPLVAGAQSFGEDDSVTVTVHGRSDGSLSSRFVFAIKEEIRESEGFSLSDQGTTLGIRVKAMDLGSQVEGIAYSCVWSVDLPNQILFLNHTVGTTPPKDIEGTAQSIVAYTDQVVEEMMDQFQQNQDSRREWESATSDFTTPSPFPLDSLEADFCTLDRGMVIKKSARPGAIAEGGLFLCRGGHNAIANNLAPPW